MKKIMIATDGSEPSLDAARFLARLPHDETIELTVATALFVPGTQQTYLVGDWIETCMDQERKSAEEAFAKIETLYEGANVTLRQVVREGNPGETLVEIAKEVQPELLLIGATGHSAIARMLLGSTSDYVATHAPCSVVVVRPTDGMLGKRPLRVAIGFEDTGPARGALEEFADFDWGSEPEVKLIDVKFIPGFYNVPRDASTEVAVEHAAEKLRDSAPTATGCVVLSDHVGEALVRFTETHETDLIVMGETPRTRLGRVLMGSMTRFVLRHVPCSVWISRNRMIHDVKIDDVQTDTANT